LHSTLVYPEESFAMVLVKRLRMQAFIVIDYMDHYMEAAT
jgi:NADPH-dependent curcumin reductase CurA